MVDCYVGMGGNQAGTLQVMRQCAVCLKSWFDNVQVSSLYRTSPVSSLPQPDFLNAVCKFQTQLCVDEVWQMLSMLEKILGKLPKQKEEPRLIDLDLLFYGSLRQSNESLTLPHPKWQERLFVLKPLADVTEALPLEGEIKVAELLKLFSNPHRETVVQLKERLDA